MKFIFNWLYATGTSTVDILRGPVVVAMTIALASWLTSQLPPSWTVFFRIFNGYTIITLLIYGFVRFGREVRRAEEQRLTELRRYDQKLDAHRLEIVNMLRDRPDLEELKRTAEELAFRTQMREEELEARSLQRHEEVKQAVEDTRAIVQEMKEKDKDGTNA